MDPNETLRRIRELVNRSEMQFFTIAEEAELRELWQSLDAWLTKGGFLPEDWSKDRLEHKW